MGSLSRPWISEFDEDYYHWEENREQYNGITPDHGNGKWNISTRHNGVRFTKTCTTLTEAQEAINTFRKSAGEGIE